MMLKPDSVRRVIAPMMAMAKTSPADPQSQRRSTLNPGAREEGTDSDAVAVVILS
jgi:hypothetical protein